MLSRVSDPEAAGIAGWIAEPEGNGVTVTFHAEPQGDAPPGVIYRANILGGRVVSRDVFLAPEGRPALNRTQARMAAARAAAAAQAHRPCGADQFNYFVVAPAGPEAPIDVYQISPQTARGRYPGAAITRRSWRPTAASPRPAATPMPAPISTRPSFRPASGPRRSLSSICSIRCRPRSTPSFRSGPGAR